MAANKQLTILDPGAVITLPQGKADLFEIRDAAALKQRTAEGTYKELRRPFQEQLNRLRDEHRPQIDHLVELKGLVNRALFVLDKTEREEQAAKDLEKMKALSKEEPKTVTVHKGLTPGPTELSNMELGKRAEPEVKKKVRVRKVQRFTLLDFSKLDDIFKLVNHNGLIQAGRAGQKVDGVKFWKEEFPY